MRLEKKDEEFDDLGQHRVVEVVHSKGVKELAHDVCQERASARTKKKGRERKSKLTHLGESPGVEVLVLAPLDKLPQTVEMRPLNGRFRHPPESKVEGEEPERERVGRDRCRGDVEVEPDKREQGVVRFGGDEAGLGAEVECEDLVPLNPLRVLAVAPTVADELDEELDSLGELLGGLGELYETEGDGDATQLPEGDVDPLGVRDDGVAVEVAETMGLDEGVFDEGNGGVDDDFSARRKKLEGLLAMGGETAAEQATAGTGDEDVERRKREDDPVLDTKKRKKGRINKSRERFSAGT